MQYTFSLTANSVERFNVVGTYLKLVSATGPVRVTTDFGRIDLLPGRGFRLGPGQQFNYVTVQDLSGAANVGVFLAGSFDLIDDRVTGEVSIVDSIGATCQHGGGSSAAVGFQATAIILPAANTRGLVVRGLLLATAAGAAGTLNQGIIAALVVPTNLQPGVGSLTIGANYSNVTVVSVINDWNLRRSFPPSWGLWFCSDASNVPTQNGYRIAYEL